MASKEQLHQLVDRLPDNEIEPASRVLAALALDPVILSILTAPPDDEPYTEEQQREDAETRARIARGEEEVVPLEDVMREFGA